MRLPTDRPLPHPGEILREEFLEPLGLTQTELAERIDVSIQRVNQVVRGRRSVTPDTALRLARLFGTTPEFWLNAQTAWDLWHARYSGAVADIEAIEPMSAGE